MHSYLILANQRVYTKLNSNYPNNQNKKETYVENMNDESSLDHHDETKQ